ncbi:HTH domain-containing protein, partial [Enterococcus faecalis]|uniref:HTH domain-containing protein n=1 Tax=Enterococcus faecalis TaxID=1351 RepID=UPI003CC5C5D6
VLIFQLLSVKAYLTAQQLADELLVSRNTIVSDLEQVERLLQAYVLTLIRQARQGFTISGEESNERLLMEFITQKELTEYDI